MYSDTDFRIVFMALVGLVATALGVIVGLPLLAWWLWHHIAWLA